MRSGDTLIVPKLDRLARSVPDARAIADRLRERGVKLALGRALYDPDDPMGKMFFNILAAFAEFEADLIRMRTREGMAIARALGGSCAASSPSCPIDGSGNSAACTPSASIPSATSPSSSPSQDQPSIAHSTGITPPSVRSCPYRNRPDPADRRLRPHPAEGQADGRRSAVGVGAGLQAALAGVAPDHPGQVGGGGVRPHDVGERVPGQHRGARRRNGGTVVGASG